MNEKKITIAGLVLSVSLLLVFCGWILTKENILDESVAQAKKRTKIAFIFADGDEGAKAATNEVVNKFNNAYPDIMLYLKAGNNGSYSEFLKMLEGEGEFPDVVEMRETARYVRAGKLSPLPEDIVALFRNTAEYDGKVYTAPYGGENTFGILYNKAYFEENGWEEPDTYEEFLLLCEKIIAKGKMAPLAVGGSDIWHMGFLFSMAYNDRVLSRDKDFIKHCYEGTKDFTDEDFKQVFLDLKTIIAYAQKDWDKTLDAQVGSLLGEGKAAMVYSGIHLISQISESYPEFELGWFPIRSHDGKIRIIGGVSSTGLAISAEAAADPDKKAAAEEFIRFFFEKSNYQEFCQRICTIPSTVEEPELDIHPAFQEVLRANDTADETFLMWNVMEGENELPMDFRDFTYKTLIEYLKDRIDLDEACKLLNEQWRR